jgi:hypothetical protein
VVFLVDYEGSGRNVDRCSSALDGIDGAIKEDRYARVDPA